MVKHKMMPIPDANVGEVLGLVEIIYAYGGKVKISFLAEELRMELDDLGDAVDMAEILHLVKVKEGVVELTVYGEAANLGSIDDKKRVLRKQLVKVEPFKSVVALVNKGPVGLKSILQHLVTHNILVEDTQRFHKLLVTWGGYAEIYEYDSNKGVYFVPPQNA
jgi:NitT/TauT family transport system ATP-binding protein